ncbi:MAG: hypothetical protein LCH26_04735 [Proteobacteria bacterium]|nr:hypothetical protein [Pseudomonadota bacterium]
MSQEMTQVPAPAPIKSVPIWGAIKEGLAFPFTMDREKARVFALHMLLVTLSTLGFMLAIFLPPVSTPGGLGVLYKVLRYGIAVPGFGAVFLGTLVTSRLYTAQRIVLGRATAPYTRLWRTSNFKHILAIYFQYILLFMITNAVIKLPDIIGVLPAFFLEFAFARLFMDFADEATQKVSASKRGWELGRGYALESYFVNAVCSVAFLGCACLISILFLYLQPRHGLEIFSLGELSNGFSSMSKLGWSVLIGIVSWVQLTSMGGISVLYRRLVLKERSKAIGLGIDVEAAMRGEEESKRRVNWDLLAQMKEGLLFPFWFNAHKAKAFAKHLTLYLCAVPLIALGIIWARMTLFPLTEGESLIFSGHFLFIDLAPEKLSYFVVSSLPLLELYVLRASLKGSFDEPFWGLVRTPLFLRSVILAVSMSIASFLSGEIIFAHTGLKKIFLLLGVYYIGFCLQFILVLLTRENRLMWGRGFLLYNRLFFPGSFIFLCFYLYIFTFLGTKLFSLVLYVGKHFLGTSYSFAKLARFLYGSFPLPEGATLADLVGPLILLGLYAGLSVWLMMGSYVFMVRRYQRVILGIDAQEATHNGAANAAPMASIWPAFKENLLLPFRFDHGKMKAFGKTFATYACGGALCGWGMVWLENHTLAWPDVIQSVTFFDGESKGTLAGILQGLMWIVPSIILWATPLSDMYGVRVIQTGDSRQAFWSVLVKKRFWKVTAMGVLVLLWALFMTICFQLDGYVLMAVGGFFAFLFYPYLKAVMVHAMLTGRAAWVVVWRMYKARCAEITISFWVMVVWVLFLSAGVGYCLYTLAAGAYVIWDQGFDTALSSFMVGNLDVTNWDTFSFEGMLPEHIESPLLAGAYLGTGMWLYMSLSSFMAHLYKNHFFVKVNE